MTLNPVKGVINKIIIVLCLLWLFGFVRCQTTNPPDPEPGSGTEMFDASKIALWDRLEWHSLGKGVKNKDSNLKSANVNCILMDGDTVYAGGYFEYANNNKVNSIARWNGSEWQGFGYVDIFDSSLFALGVFEDFQITFGGINSVPGAVNDMVMSSSVDFGKTLYVGGSFPVVVNDDNFAPHILDVNNIAMYYLELGLWDMLTDLGTLVTGTTGAVNALDVGIAGLFVGGTFDSAGGVADTNLIARYSIQNTSWVSIGGGIIGTEVNAITVTDDGINVYVGGNFTQAGNVSVQNVAKWTGSNWQAVGAGLNGTVYDIVILGSDIYAAGQFFTADYESFHVLARWDGSTWAFMGDQITPAGQQEKYDIKGLALTSIGNNLYLGGHFETMDGENVNHIVCLNLNDNTWTELTGGVHNIGADTLSGVKALATSGNDVVVGGTFTAVGIAD
jgi:hypothetical protein